MHIFCGYFQFYKIINEYFNQKAQVFISNLSNHLKDQFSNIITKGENNYENFKNFINDIFNCSYGDYLQSKNDEKIEYNFETPLSNKNEDEIDITYKSVEKILKKFDITKDNLEEAIKSFDKKKRFVK